MVLEQWVNIIVVVHEANWMVFHVSGFREAFGESCCPVSTWVLRIATQAKSEGEI